MTNCLGNQRPKLVIGHWSLVISHLSFTICHWHRGVRRSHAEEPGHFPFCEEPILTYGKAAVPEEADRDPAQFQHGMPGRFEHFANLLIFSLSENDLVPAVVPLTQETNPGTRELRPIAQPGPHP